MDLLIQLQVFIVSFVYGILFAYILKLEYHVLFDSKIWYQALLTILFILDNCLLYFLILKTINHGIFHIYFLFMLILGFLFGNYLLNRKKQ